MLLDDLIQRESLLVRNEEVEPRAFAAASAGRGPATETLAPRKRATVRVLEADQLWESYFRSP